MAEGEAVQFLNMDHFYSVPRLGKQRRPKEGVTYGN